MRKQQGTSPAFDYEKSAEARKVKAAEKAAVGLKLNWTRKQSILAYCHQCMNNQPSLVRECGGLTCPLWPYRTRKPVSAREMKCWEGHFRASADGQRFLKEDAAEEAEQEAVPELPSEEEW